MTSANLKIFITKNIITHKKHYSMYLSLNTVDCFFFEKQIVNYYKKSFSDLSEFMQN